MCIFKCLGMHNFTAVELIAQQQISSRNEEYEDVSMWIKTTAAGAVNHDIL